MGQCSLRRKKIYHASDDGEGSGKQTDVATAMRARSRSDVNLDQLLQNAATHEAFGRFLRERFEENTLLFFEAVEEFRVMPGSKAEVQERACEICDMFVRVGAPGEVNLDSVTRSELIDNITNKSSKENIFSFASEKVFQKLKFELFPQFLISNEFKTLDKKVDAAKPDLDTVSELSSLSSHSNPVVAAQRKTCVESANIHSVSHLDCLRVSPQPPRYLPHHAPSNKTKGPAVLVRPAPPTGLHSWSEQRQERERSDHALGRVRGLYGHRSWSRQCVPKASRGHHRSPLLWS